VLAVDDEPSFLDVETQYLAKHQIEVSSCGSVPEAIDELVDGEYDVVVSDYQMPNLTGIDLLKTLRKEGNNVGFILLTGKGREDVAIDALNEGADYYIQKGIGLPSLFALLARIVDEVSSARESSRALVESENLLRISNDRLDLLGSITRHDIRGEVTVASGYIGLAEEEADPARVREHLSKAKDAIDKVIGIIEIARTYQINGAMNIKWSSLREALSHSAASIDLSGLAYEDKVEDWTILVDPMLEMVIANIFSNSIRHGKNVTRIRVSSEEVADGLDLTIEDDGIGIALEEKGRIFGLKTDAGIPHGLAIARRILEAERIKINETGIHGKGARFVLHFPPGLYRKRLPFETFRSIHDH
jgi:signal transduction histidine kinase